MNHKPSLGKVDLPAECFSSSVACEPSAGSDSIGAGLVYQSAPAEEPCQLDVPVQSSVQSKRLEQGNLQRNSGLKYPLASAEAGDRSARVEAVSGRTSGRRSGAGAVSNSAVLQAVAPRAGHWKLFGAPVNQKLKIDEVVERIDSGRLWVVNSRRRNGLIVLREFHAEFAGPGAAVGGSLDKDIVKVIPIGNLSLLEPDSHEAHQNAIKIRLQWIRLTQNFTDQPSPDDRARMILEQFKTYFDRDTVDAVPDRAFAMLVGVLPQTIRRVRAGFVW